MRLFLKKINKKNVKTRFKQFLKLKWIAEEKAFHNLFNDLKSDKKESFLCCLVRTKNEFLDFRK